MCIHIYVCTPFSFDQHGVTVIDYSWMIDLPSSINCTQCFSTLLLSAGVCRLYAFLRSTATAFRYWNTYLFSFFC